MEHLRNSSISLMLTILTTLTYLVSSHSFLPQSLPQGLQSEITTDPTAISSFATDFGNLSTSPPGAIFYPSSPNDIAALIRFSYMSSKPFTISQRGAGHSAHGQTFVPNGILIDMSALARRQPNSRINVTNGPIPYVDAGGEQLWIDVLNATLKYGLTLRTSTDYLRLSVGGTLSNAGINGRAFKNGPLISNVYELDVITGTGEIVTCSKEMNSDLFYAALGGLGQFGVITRARIALEPAQPMARWMRFIYTDVKLVTGDQEKLISTGNNLSGLDYMEGTLLLNQAQISMISSYFSDSEVEKITQLAMENKGSTYLLDVVAFYNNMSSVSVDEKEKLLMEELHYVSGFNYSRDVTYFDFMNRLNSGELAARAAGVWFGPHPWLVLLLPKSKVLEFDSMVYKGIVKNTTAGGSVLLYPMNKNMWDDKMSAVTPEEEEIFYAANFLWSATPNNTNILTNDNNQMLNLCDQNGWGCKKYLPYYSNQADWQKQFGKKWGKFVSMKKKFDPKALLCPGQQIFTPLSMN